MASHAGSKIVTVVELSDMLKDSHNPFMEDDVLRRHIRRLAAEVERLRGLSQPIGWSERDDLC